jgi:predicted transcriptional regulator
MLPNIDEMKRRRKNLGLTQKNLAGASGVSQSIIAKIESKKVSPSYAIVKRILDILEGMEKRNQITAKHVLSSRIISIEGGDRIRNAAKLMREHGYSQLPVFDKGHLIGSISEKAILDQISGGKKMSDLMDDKVIAIMEESFPTVRENESASAIVALLQDNHAVLVIRNGKALGIITKTDLLKSYNSK